MLLLVEWFQVRWWLEQRKTKSAIATLERVSIVCEVHYS